MDPSWLPTVPLTGSGRPVLLPAEVERSLLPSVDLLPEPNPNPNPNSIPAIKSVLLILTSHRLLLVDEPSATARALPLSSVVHAFPPKKSLKHLFSSSPKIRIQISSSDVLTIAVRGGKSDPEAFFERLWEALKARAWEESAAAAASEGSAAAAEGSRGGGGGGGGGGIRMPVVGVAGLMRKEQEMWENTDKSLHDAFQDLNALMSKAKEMVSLAEKMRLKLLSTTSAQQENANDGEMGSKQEMQDWLLSVGIASPVTKESAGALYHQQLARQLADFVKLPLEKAGGMIALVDVYCLFNRARGTELISPEDLLQACALWEKLDVPVMLRKFDSGKGHPE
ncbi:vacuolar protein sorting-associated protein 36 isoform X1 [Iris pallida]|uniref:Vacuolar protein-sorting-associated protein 36 n=1 Tax=Iris pallida TaxID=29817 RepID=A0AAX6F4N9_IRIPA|nr:vacuolar protein sorting-associated protein 36 isoform X1 [Iris pallida]